MTLITVKLLKNYEIEIEENWNYETLITTLSYYFNCKEKEIIINNNYNKLDIIDTNNLNIIIELNN